MCPELVQTLIPSVIDASGNGDIGAANSVPFAKTNAVMMGWIHFTRRVRRNDIRKHAARRIRQTARQFNGSKAA